MARWNAILDSTLDFTSFSAKILSTTFSFAETQINKKIKFSRVDSKTGTLLGSIKLVISLPLFLALHYVFTNSR